MIAHRRKGLRRAPVSVSRRCTTFPRKLVFLRLGEACAPVAKRKLELQVMQTKRFCRLAHPRTCQLTQEVMTKMRSWRQCRRRRTRVITLGNSVFATLSRLATRKFRQLAGIRRFQEQLTVPRQASVKFPSPLRHCAPSYDEMEDPRILSPFRSITDPFLRWSRGPAPNCGTWRHVLPTSYIGRIV